MAKRTNPLAAVLHFLILATILLCLLPVLIVALPFLLGRKIIWLFSYKGRQTLRARFGWGMGVAELARRLGIDAHELRSFEPRYRRTAIRKRRGGMRTLHVPSAGTKEIQRAILRRLLRRLRAHDAAHGFERARSIVTNAAPHANKRCVIKLDVVDFFPTTTADRIERYFRRIGWNKEVAALLTRLTTHDGGLPQGAPTSPRLSNLVNYRLDAQLAARAARRDAAYTRYADDITFSMDDDYGRHILGLIQYTRRSLRAYGYAMHRQKKLIVRRQHAQQLVTGLVVNRRPRLPRRTRRWLRAVRHRLETTGRCTLTQPQLRGWTALETMVERGGES